MILSPSDRAAIRQRCERATKGPWREGTYNVWNDELLRCVAKTDRRMSAKHDDSREQQQFDAEFIAHAREDIPRLSEALAVAEQQRDELNTIRCDLCRMQQEMDFYATVLIQDAEKSHQLIHGWAKELCVLLARSRCKS